MSPPAEDPSLPRPFTDEQHRPDIAYGMSQSVLDLARTAIIVRDLAQGTIVFWNSGAEELYGWTKDEAVGKSTRSLLQTQCAQPLEVINEALLRVGSWSGELLHTTRSGHQIVVESHWIVVENNWTEHEASASRPQAFLEINTNITARKEAEQERRRAEERFRGLLEAAPDGIVACDADGRILLVNSQTELLFGYAREELVGQLVELLLPTALHSQHTQHRAGYMVDPRTRPMGSGLELYARRKDGSTFPCEISLSPVASEGETLITAVIRNISARKRAEEARRRAEERFRDLLESAPDAIVTSDGTGRILLVNAQVEKLFGYRREELIGQQVELLLPAPLHTVHSMHRAGYVADPHTRPMGIGLELYVRTRDGREVPVEISLSPLTSEGELLVTAVIRDISARRAADAALRESEGRLRTVTTNAPVILFSLDSAGIVTLCEGQGLTSLGLAPGVVVGHPVTAIFHDDEAILDRVRQTLAGVDCAFVSQAGGVALDTSLVPLRDDSGEVRGVIGVATDVTERVRAEAAERAVQARDAFLSIAAHELKTPLTSLRGFAQILLTYLNGGAVVSPERIQRALLQIDGQSDKVNRLVDQLLDVTRLEGGRLTLDRQATNLTQLVHEVVTAAQTQTSDHTLVIAAPPAAWAWVDALRLEQVLTNLVANAIKYSPAGGTITVSVAPNMADETMLLSVRDHGLGVAEEHRAHIFDRFYQAHASSFRSGLGLGLYVSREIMVLHGGQLTAEFPAEGGSLFLVRLPIGGDKIVASPQEEQRAQRPRVLIVDDDAGIRDLVDLVLSDQGYEVISASDGLVALGLVEQTTPDVILLDMRMPVLDGCAFAATYRAQPGPHAPIIVCTAARDAATSAAQIQATAYLAKPFTVGDLVTCVATYAHSVR